MKKARSRSPSFADPPMGSVGPMTRARRRRLLAESSERSGTKNEASVQDLGWRDWANLTCDLAEDIAGRLLSHDVAEYHRFRAVCRPWRHHAADLRARGAGAGAGALDRRFRPRNWVVLTISPDAGPRRLVLNTATAASLSVNLPALTTHCHLGAVDGLLILFHRTTRAFCLLDPLSNAVTQFPAYSASSIVVIHRRQLFTFGGVTGRIEVLEVDIAGRTLVPVSSLGHQAAFVGMTHCVLVSSKTFPSIAADAIYLGYCL